MFFFALFGYLLTCLLAYLVTCLSSLCFVALVHLFCFTTPFQFFWNNRKKYSTLKAVVKTTVQLTTKSFGKEFNNKYLNKLSENKSFLNYKLLHSIDSLLTSTIAVDSFLILFFSSVFFAFFCLFFCFLLACLSVKPSNKEGEECYRPKNKFFCFLLFLWQSTNCNLVIKKLQKQKQFLLSLSVIYFRIFFSSFCCFPFFFFNILKLIVRKKWHQKKMGKEEEKLRNFNAVLAAIRLVYWLLDWMWLSAKKKFPTTISFEL